MGAGESLVCLPGRLLSVRETVGAPPCAGGETQPGENGPHTRGWEGWSPPWILEGKAGSLRPPIEYHTRREKHQEI